MLSFTLISVAMLLDALIGEPNWLWARLPHPVRLMGYALTFFDKRLNTGRFKRAKGALVLCGLVLVCAGLGLAISALPFGAYFEVICAAILIGHRSLTQHVLAVAQALQGGLPEGRQAVAMIVGRDVKDLDESAVARAAIESAAENFSDGVVAPVFWFVVAGLPGIIVYKMINTADSMIGYLNAQYSEFGWAAARLDDLVNLIPARLSAVLIALATGSRAALGAARADAGRHRSPNAGWPEAAMAGALGVALSGPRVYFGVPTQDAYVNESGRKLIGPPDITRAVRVIWRSWAVLLVLCAGLAFLKVTLAL